MKNKISFTQKNISIALTLLACIISCVLFFRMMYIFMPPLIYSVKIDDQYQENNIIVKGIMFGSQDPDANIYINGNRIEHMRIIRWTNTKIVLQSSKNEKNIGLILIQVREKRSNNKVFVFSRDTNSSGVDERVNPNTFKNIETTPRLANNTPIHPFSPIILENIKKDYLRKWSIEINNILYPLPAHLWQYDYAQEKKILYMDDRYWFHTKNQNNTISIFAQTNTNTTYKYTLPLVIIDTTPSMSTEFQISVVYSANQGMYSYLLPMQTKYQQVFIQDKKFRVQKTLNFNESFMYITTPQSIMQMRVKHNAIFTASESSTSSPVIYNDEQIFKFLFDTITPDENKKIQSIINTHSPSTVDANNIINPSILANTQLRKKFSLQNLSNPVSDEITESQETEWLNYINTYISSVIKRVETIGIEEVQELSFIPYLSFIKLEHNIEIIRNIIATYILRKQGLIARTIIGISIGTKLNEKEKEVYVTNSISLIEILSKKSGWITINNNALSSTINTLALYTFEQYIQLYNNKQRPLVPQTINIISLTPNN